MTTENKKQPLAEQESYALSNSNKERFLEATTEVRQTASKFTNRFSKISRELFSLLYSYGKYSFIKELPDISYLEAHLDTMEKSAKEILEECAKVRQELKGKEENNA
jgi:acyl carrier protein phosphodiesterase